MNEELILLYSYLNSDCSNQPLSETVEHYLTEAVEHDLIEKWSSRCLRLWREMYQCMEMFTVLPLLGTAIK